MFKNIVRKFNIDPTNSLGNFGSPEVKGKVDGGLNINFKRILLKKVF